MDASVVWIDLSQSRDEWLAVVNAGSVICVEFDSVAKERLAC